MPAALMEWYVRLAMDGLTMSRGQEQQVRKCFAIEHITDSQT